MAEKWIQGAIKKPGALREKMGVKEGEKIPKGEISSKISQLQKEGEGEKKLNAPKRALLKQLVLARTLGEMNK
ncbi:MAG: hypothetical protein RLZZ53_1002 [Acidobacteriota bacterium]|jgi:hypothetical protein